MSVMDTKDIAYNCGALLAVADAIESWALREKTEDKKTIRITNAMRYYTRFRHHPSDTWALLSDKLVPYKNQLGGKAGYLNALLGEFSGKINPEDMRKLRNLDGAFVLGFDSQRQEIINKVIEHNRKKEAAETDD